MTRPLFIAIAIFGILVGGRGWGSSGRDLGALQCGCPCYTDGLDQRHLSFPQFNPALGTLTAVTITLSGTLDTTLTVTNQGSSNSSGSATTEVQVSVWTRTMIWPATARNWTSSLLRSLIAISAPATASSPDCSRPWRPAPSGRRTRTLGRVHRNGDISSTGSM